MPRLLPLSLLVLLVQATALQAAPCSKGKGYARPSSSALASKPAVPSVPPMTNQAAVPTIPAEKDTAAAQPMDSSAAPAPAPAAPSMPASEAAPAAPTMPASEAAPAAPSMPASEAASAAASEPAPVADSASAPATATAVQNKQVQAAPAPASAGFPCRRMITWEVNASSDLLTPLLAGQAKCYYSWHANPPANAPKDNFIPLPRPAPIDNVDWNNLPALLTGSKTMLGGNEPDLNNVDAGQAAAEWIKSYHPVYDAGATLVLPAITQGGQAWLKSFMAACTGCKFTYGGLHWCVSLFFLAKSSSFLHRFRYNTFSTDPQELLKDMIARIQATFDIVGKKIVLSEVRLSVHCLTWCNADPL